MSTGEFALSLHYGHSRYYGTVPEHPITRRSLIAGGALLFAGPRRRGRNSRSPSSRSTCNSFRAKSWRGPRPRWGSTRWISRCARADTSSPPRVARDLPPLVAATRKHGLEVSMVTTDVVDADTPYTEDMLKRRRRWASATTASARSSGRPTSRSKRRWTAFEPRLAKLAALNRRYNMCAMYHTHSGVGPGGRLHLGPAPAHARSRPQGDRHQLRRGPRHHRGRPRRLDRQLPDLRTACCAASR